jgi:hypothetical protein
MPRTKKVATQKADKPKVKRVLPKKIKDIIALAKAKKEAGMAWRSAVAAAAVELRAAHPGDYKPKVVRAKKPKAPKAEKPKKAPRVKKTVAHGDCFGFEEPACAGDCHWVKATTTKAGKARKAHCAAKRVGAKKMTLKEYAMSMPF